MEGRYLPEFRPGMPERFRGALAAALQFPDAALVGELIEHAHAGGAAADQLYVEAVRPALREAARTWPPSDSARREALAVAALSTTFAAMAAQDEELGNGAGRRAMVVGDHVGPGGLDTQVLVELLEHAGWMITTLPPDHLDARRLIDRLEPAAIVLVGESAAGLAWPDLRDALREVQSAPLVVLCRFDGDIADLAEAGHPGVDALVSRPAAALALLRDRFAQASLPAWGVALRRESDTLVVTPSGRLDHRNAARLRDIVDSRAGSFEHLVLNLRDLSAAEETALGETLRWVRENGWETPPMPTAPRP